MRATPAILALFAALGAGCRACDDAAPPRADADAGPRAASCERRTAERLGIPFVKVCPQDLGAAGAAFEPFWIAAAPLGCSAGEHDTLACPNVVALEHPAPGETRAPRPVKARLAAVIDPDVAQSVCYMRFAGRLPTREERSRAEAAMGLAAVMVAERGAPPHFDFVRLSEWVTPAACEAPQATKCAPATWPEGPRAAIPWGAVHACDASPLAPDASTPALAIGESCPAAAFAWDPKDPTALPCAVRSPAPRPSVLGYALSCRPVIGQRREDDGIGATAAFRCVVPELALLAASGGGP